MNREMERMTKHPGIWSVSRRRRRGAESNEMKRTEHNVRVSDERDLAAAPVAYHSTLNAFPLPPADIYRIVSQKHVDQAPASKPDTLQVNSTRHERPSWRLRCWRCKQALAKVLQQCAHIRLSNALSLSPQHGRLCQVKPTLESRPAGSKCGGCA